MFSISSIPERYKWDIPSSIQVIMKSRKSSGLFSQEIGPSASRAVSRYLVANRIDTLFALAVWEKHMDLIWLNRFLVMYLFLTFFPGITINPPNTMIMYQLKLSSCARSTNHPEPVGSISYDTIPSSGHAWAPGFVWKKAYLIIWALRKSLSKSFTNIQGGL